MVFVGVGAQRGQNRRVHVADLSWEQRRVAKVHQSLVAVITQELLDVLGQAHTVVEGLGILHFVVVQLVEQVVGVVLHIHALGVGELGDALLVLVANVVAMHGLVTDDKANHVGGVGQLGVRGEVHRQVKAGVEEERFEQGGGHLALVRVVALVVVEHNLRLLLQELVVLAPVEGRVDLLGGAQGGKDGRVALGMHGFHEGDVGVHGFLVRGERVRNQGDGADRALVPVDCGDAVDEFQRFARNRDRCHE